jgi:sulfide:quinone oxidoreductase
MSPRPRVLVAGGGVAGLETLLALRHLLGDRVRVEVLAPEAEFSYRQFSVAEPFSMGEVATFDLAGLIEDAGGVHRRDALKRVDAGAKIATTAAGARIPYEALVIAVGARPTPALPGAQTFLGPASNPAVHQAVLRLARGRSRGLAFAVPGTVHWPLPAYELALLAAAHLADVGAAGSPVHLVTGERDPLELFGPAISEQIAARLAAEGVTMHTTAPARAVGTALVLVDGTEIRCDDVVALPGLQVPPIAGLSQGPRGFLTTDLRMRVEGAEGVYAVGDVSWFPVKQGGLAAQQADVAASCIARTFDPDIDCPPFQPRLRAALLTGDGPIYLRAGQGGAPAMSQAPLWWPPGKVAGRYLTPFIAGHAAAANQPDPALIDLEAGGPDRETDHREAVELALHAAESDARLNDYAGALRWLAVAERLHLTLPAEYALRREQWRRLGA